MADRPESLAAWIRGTTWMDRILLFLLFALVWYIAFMVFSAILGAEWPFDVMLVSGGALFLVLAMPASHIGARTTKVLQTLDGSGAVTFNSDTERNEVQAALEKTGRRYGLIGMTGLVAAILLALAGAQFGGGQPWSELVALGSVQTVCAGYTGYRFGQFYGNGELFRLLKEKGHDLRGGGGLVAQAIVPLRQLYSIAVGACLCLCLFFNLWWAAWALRLKLADDYSQWRASFLMLAMVSILALLVVGLVPVQRFNRRLEAIQGDPVTRRAVVARRRTLATEDIVELQAQIDALGANQTQRQMADDLNGRMIGLIAYRDGLSDTVRGDRIMRPITIFAAAACSTLVLAVCVLVTGVSF